MPPVAIILLVLITGILAGYFGAYYRSRGDAEPIRVQVDTHSNLALRQHQMQIEAVRQADLQQRQADAYDQLGAWLYNLERAIDEVWFGCCSNENDAARKRARRLLDMWPWETLRVPMEARSAEFYWSADVRNEIRRFKDESATFFTQAAVAILDTPTSETANISTKRSTAAWNARCELLATLDGIRDRVRVDLGLPTDS